MKNKSNNKCLFEIILTNKWSKAFLIFSIILFGKDFLFEKNFHFALGQQTFSYENNPLSLPFGENYSQKNSNFANVSSQPSSASLQSPSNHSSPGRQKNVPLMSYHQTEESSTQPSLQNIDFVSPGSSSYGANQNNSPAPLQPGQPGFLNNSSNAINPVNPSPSTVENQNNQSGTAGTNATGTPRNPETSNSSKETNNDKLFIPYLKKPVSEMITGQDCYLEELLNNSYSHLDRYQRIHAYWTLTEKLAIYNIYIKQMLDIQECLNRYPNIDSIPQNVRPLLTTTRILAQQKIKEAEIDFVMEQYQFISQYQRNQSYLNETLLNANQSISRSDQLKKILPIPVSLPTLNPYQTRFEEMSKTRRLSKIAQKLNLTIPLQYQVIVNRLNEVNQSFICLKTLFLNKESKEEQLFNALEKNTQAKLKFVQAVFTYNRMIAAYVSETVGNQLLGERYFSTLNLHYLTPSQIKKKMELPINPAAKIDVGQNRKHQTFRPVVSQTFISNNSIVRGQDPLDPNSQANSVESDSLDKPTVSNSPVIPNVNSPSIPNATNLDSKAITEPSKREVPEEVRRQINDLSATLFPILTAQSGAGDSPIIEIPLTLNEAVSKSWEARQRLDIVEAYWKLRTTLSKLEVEKTIEAKGRQTLLNLDKNQKESQTPLTPELENVIRNYLVFLNDSLARIASLKIAVRNEQIELMTKMNRATENGWPIPTTLPFAGPTYNLESDRNLRFNFILLTESVLIPEKMKAIEEFSIKMGPKENLLQPEINAFANNEDAIIYLKILDNKRSMALSFIQMIESLNISVARYVSNYSESFIPNDIFINSLIGSVGTE
ncbi:MAG: hypothetical protein Q4C95_00585 [Planctomycetia bacterium]|nr:hypothetical protein [Planctomycetia bacterium]